jgi:hypothetical protein
MISRDNKRVFDSVVAVAFQIIFCAEMHVSDIFLFFKNYFLHQHIKTIQNVQTILNFSKKIKKLNFLKTRFAPRSQTHSKSTHTCKELKKYIFKK